MGSGSHGLVRRSGGGVKAVGGGFAALTALATFAAVTAIAVTAAALARCAFLAIVLTGLLAFAAGLSINRCARGRHVVGVVSVANTGGVKAVGLRCARGCGVAFRAITTSVIAAAIAWLATLTTIAAFTSAIAALWRVATAFAACSGLALAITGRVLGATFLASRCVFVHRCSHRGLIG